ncbi:hypothetical protein EN741_28180 [Mesorhizobium sp. M4B.F.Ca.ET.019.03.1.1]|uniref:hypothetical protein n=1 Tax=Mesorhizobium sp. M4B.F.Ca.ET.019.03.1.1 TaxID=2496651 RepID=UPI000FCB2491|nr:hypothetical protein [Mesorhizobium sp. M4B.F.Ca.ET.019.03.1.1]RVD35282.1 hypothetical protein EN741_28180 [Mesorhizobium sp. M4B.F.Ca.ET.019.03.1.1]
MSLDDLTIEADHLTSLLNVLVDMTVDCNTSLEHLRQVNALATIARDMADRNTEALEQCQRSQMEAGKRAA